MLQLAVALVAGAASVALGLLVVARGQGAQHRIGWLLVAHGVTLGLFLAFPDSHGSGHVGLVVDQLTQGSWVLIFLWLVLVAYLLPDGHPASRRWARWMRVGLAGCVAFAVGAAGDAQGFAEVHGGHALPVPWLPEAVSAVLGVGGLLLVVALLFGSFVSLWRRTHRAAGDERLQLLWPLWGSLLVPLTLALGWVDHFLLEDRLPFQVVLAVLGVALPGTIAAAVLRHRLFDIELVLSRTLTYAVLTVLVVGSYAGLLALADAVGGHTSAGGLVAVGLVAVLVHPTYDRLRRRVERLVYGDRSDPATALRRLGASAASADPLHLVETVAASVAEALRVDEAWVEGAGQVPREDDHVVRVPLVHRGTRLGDLAVLVPAGRHLGAADLALLQDLAGHAAVTVRAGQLTAELQESRSRIVSAREEERRRLRRDLHDGLGPSLAAIVLTLDAVQGLTDEERRHLLVAEVQDEARAMVREVRRLVDDLRPAAIDEVGLVAAVRQRAAALSTDALTFVVSGPELLPPLPAAVEVAAYRIASEAMTNVARHSGASRCTVEMELDGNLGLTVSDNGRGADGPTGSGVGWASMTERAAELGGACTVSSRAGGGLVVRAVLPLAETAAETAADPAVDLEGSR